MNINVFMNDSFANFWCLLNDVCNTIDLEILAVVIAIIEWLILLPLSYILADVIDNV